MEISKKMLDALKLRKENEFNLASDLIYQGIDLGKIRGKIGHRGKDISHNVITQKLNINNITCYKYFVKEKTDYLLINLHGGGFYGGSAEISENNCKYLSYYGDIHVINIEYTLAPDSKFPETMYEIYDIIEKLKQEYKNCKIGILGDSAGGHLAMNVALLDIENLEIIDFIALYYPIISLEERENWNISKYNLSKDDINAKAGILFLKSIMKLIKKLYLEENYDRNSKYFNLLNIEKEEFKKLPKIFLAKAGIDYYNIDIDEFCNKYSIDSVEYEGLFHGFAELLSYVDEVKDLLELTVKKFKE